MDIIEKIINEGNKYGDVAVIKKKSDVFSADFSNKKILSTENGKNNQLLIRVSKENKFGYSTTSDFSKWKKCLKDAVKIMNASSKLKNNIHLSNPSDFKSANMIYSGRVVEMPVEKMLEKGYQIIENVGEKFEIPSMSISKSYEKREIGNTNGLLAKQKETSFSTMVEVKSGEITGRDVRISRDLFNPIEVGKESKKLCSDSLNPKPVKIFKGSLILDYFAIAGIIEAVLVPAVSADEIQSKRSILADKIGEKIFSDKITIIDDGLLKKGLMSYKFDYEGTPSQKTVVIENGIFKNPLYDIYSAKKDDTESTGNCGGLDQIPSIKPTNFILSPGDYSRDEIISETKKGVLAKYGVGYHLINKVTGDCSIGIENSFYVENGEVKYPIKQAMVSFNLFDKLKELKIIGKNLRQETCVVAPTVRFDNVQIIG